ncbi:NACHT domain-containing protein [Desulfococcaceae bacterium HSG7]|nr:NACHT domain-containing protein [Desulfococcaceae bacterium HSG7]
MKDSKNAVIVITAKNMLAPKEKLKRLEICIFCEANDGIKTNPDTNYPLSQYVGKKIVGMRSMVFLSTVFPGHVIGLGHVITQNGWDITNSSVVYTENKYKKTIIQLKDLPLNPSKYKFTVIINEQSAKKDVTILDLEKEIVAGGSYTFSITTPSFFEEIIKKINTKEGLLVSIILGLIAILVGVLKDSIKKGFESVLDGLGKYSRGKLAERRFLKRYLDNIIFNHKYLKLVGFNTAGISRPLLEEIFVSLRVSAYDIQEDDSLEETSGISFATVLKRYKQLVILGGPGAGKTTTLSYALLMFAQNRAKMEFDMEDSLLPIFIPLRRLSMNNNTILEDLMSEDSQILPKYLLKECPDNYFEKKLKKGQCLLLLDGLDEVTDEKTHRLIAEKINNMAAAYPDNRFAVTCRIAGWKDLLSGFRILETQDFSRDEIHRFVRGWERAIITQSERSKLEFDIPDKKRFEEKWKVHKEKVVAVGIDVQARKLIHAIDSNNRILAIAVNPMLLSLIALVHHNRAILPKGRTILYAQCIELLIDAWDRTRDITSSIEITADQKETILREIAFEFQHKGKSEDTRESLEQLIQTIAPKIGIGIPAPDLLRDIETRSGMLIERSIDVLGFAHLTLQEYLVASYIQLNPDNYTLIRKNVDAQEWREVTLLYAGLMDDASPLVRDILKTVNIKRLVIAGYCIGDAKQCDKNLTEPIINKLMSLCCRADKHTETVINALAAIASDYKEPAITVEQNLSERLIDVIQNGNDINEKIHAITVLGRARITFALPNLVNLFQNESMAIRKVAAEAIIRFGNLAIPQLEQYVDSRKTEPNDFELLLNILSGINTVASAKLLLKLYALQDKTLDIKVSLILARMLKNPFIEEDLSAIEPANLPEPLQKMTSDGKGWVYKKQPTPAFLSLDKKLREDILSVITEHDTNDNQGALASFAWTLPDLSFKMWFPAFLQYLISRNKFGVSLLKVFIKIEYPVLKNSYKIVFLCDRIKGDSSLSLEYALKGIGSDTSDPFKETKGQKWLKGIANVYFVLFLGWSIFWNGFLVQWDEYLSNDISNISRYFDVNYCVNDEYKYAVFFGMLFCVYYIFLILYTHLKMKRNVFSFSIIDTIFCPFSNFLKLIPYVIKIGVWINWIILFCVPSVTFTYFFGLYFDSLSGQNTGIIKSIMLLSLPYFYIIPSFVLILLSFLYLKYIVLKANPIYHLMLLHPEGRKVLRGE